MLELDDQQQLTDTLRQRMEQHRANPTCASCHTKMDAIGFALENYDAVGGFRALDAGASSVYCSASPFIIEAMAREGIPVVCHLGDYDERPPRHAKAYRNFAAEHARLQQERLAAFREYIADVHAGRFPERSHLVEMEVPLLDEVVRSLK